MKLTIIPVATLFATAALTTTPALAQQDPSWSQQVAPFFNKYCVECHNDKKPQSGLSLESYKSLMEGGDHGPAVLAGQPDDSRLVKMVEGLQEPKMPTPKAQLQPKMEEYTVVRAWVKAGAKFDQATVKVVLPAIKSKIQAAPPVSALAYFPDGKHLIIGAYKDLLLCDSAKGSLVGRLGALPLPVTAVALNKEGNRLAVALGQSSVGGQVKIFPVNAAGTPVWGNPLDIAAAHADVIHQLDFSPDGKRLLTCGYDRLVKIWDAGTGANVKTLKEHADSVYGVCYRPDGKLFATGAADRAVKIWQADTGKLLYTLGESTDWVYAVAWSPDSKYLAAAGVDKSIRVWEAGETEGKVIHSVFAHQAPVLRLVYSADGKTLYSLSEDRTVKAWETAKMTERKVYSAQPEAVQALALHPKAMQLALGRHDGALLLLEESTGKVQSQPLPHKQKEVPAVKLAQQEHEPNDSPGTGQKITLPCTVTGTIAKAGDIDFYRFEARAGEQFGVNASVTAPATKDKQKLNPFLQLTTSAGKVLVQSNDGYLGHTFTQDGWYSLGISDREYEGNPNMTYELRLGDVPVVSAIFPLGVQQGWKAAIQIEGVHLGGFKTVPVSVDGKAQPGSMITIPFPGAGSAPIGLRKLIVGEFPDILEQSGKVLTVPVPGTANGVISAPGETDTWRFHAKKGQKLILETNARRLGSDLDSYLEVLDAKGKPVALATLRSLAKTFVTFRDHNSAQANIRIDAWSELTVNDYIYVGTELLKIRALPTHPDADCNFFSEKGKRLGYLNTTPTHVSKNEYMYKVAIHPPGTTFAPNGFPVVTLYYRNDDGGADYGRDSRIVFESPEDGDYQVRIGDASSQGGINYAYRLTIRPPRPSFNVSFNPTAPAVWKGGALPITVTADRFDGFDGTIKFWFDNLPPGFSAPPSNILGNDENTVLALWADANAKDPDKGQPLKLIAEAVIDGQVVRKESTGQMIKAVDPGDLVTTTEQSEVTIKPGGQAKLTLSIERKNGFTGRVPINVQGLPHGVKVLDIGLNGILITEKETKRTIVFYCEPWVQALEHPIVIAAQREGKNTAHAAKSVLLKVANGQAK